MYGWRGRIGLMVPSTNTVMESEFHKIPIKGVSFHTTRLRQYEVTNKSLANMATHLDRAIDELKSAAVQLLIYGCTSGSFFMGIEWEEELTKSMEERWEVKILTTSQAVNRALTKLKVKDLVIITPYEEGINQLEKDFFEALGYQVKGIRGLGLRNCLTIGSLHYSQTYKLAREHGIKGDALFISCTDFRSFEILETLEMDLGIPVVSSNQASLWAALRELGIKETIKGYGQLMEG